MANKRSTSLTVPIPKHIAVAARASADPGSVPAPGALIPNRSNLISLFNSDIQNIRHSQNVTEMLRILARAEGPLSTAVHNIVQTANNGYKIFAYTAEDNLFSRDGTQLAMTLVAQLNTLYDYSEGFSNKKPINSVLELMMREAILTNGVGCELVLKKGFLPDRLQVIPLETLRWRNDEDGKTPVPVQYQHGKAEPVSLDIPTFWVERMVGDPADLYPRSMLDSAVKLLVYFEEFLDDIRRVVRQSGHAKQVVAIDLEKAKAAAPRDIQNSPAKLKEWFANIQTAVKDQLESISPEDAIVLFDTATYKIESPSFGNKIDYTPMLSMVAGMLATSMKTPPSVLGMRTEAGSQGLGNIETLVFLKSARAVHTPVASAMSRALTLACRLYGFNGYVSFEFDPLDLRPELELESFYTMQQERILEALSYGFMSDDEASIRLGYGLRPEGAPKLSGTMFNVAKSGALPINPGDTPAGKANAPSKDTPQRAGGKSQ